MRKIKQPRSAALYFSLIYIKTRKVMVAELHYTYKLLWEFELPPLGPSNPSIKLYARPEIIIKTVPIKAAQSAFLAISILAPPPEVKNKIPAISHPIITIVAPMAVNFV